MDLNAMFNQPDEKPLDNLVTDGGFCGIFRKIGCIGDSLSSGEFEGINAEGQKTYHDYFDYSWGQYLARMAGCTVYNFSRGGMTASEYCNTFAEANGYWDRDKACTAYIIALGVNDLFGQKQKIGSVDDIDFRNYKNNKPTFAGYYARLIQAYKRIQPDAKFFLMTTPRSDDDEEIVCLKQQHADLLYKLAEVFDNCYVLDFWKYAPVYDKEFEKKFFLGGHMNPMGYLLTAKMVASYIDYIIRHNMKDFAQVGFIGTEHQYREVTTD